MSDDDKQPLHRHLSFMLMPMESSLAPFGQVFRHLCLIESWQSRESLPGTAVPGCCLGTALHLNCHNSYLTPRIEVILSIIELLHHELSKTHGLTFVTPSLHGWEAFPTPGALTTLGSLGPSHQRRHKSQVSLRGSSCDHGVSGTPHGEVRDTEFEMVSLSLETVKC